MAKPGSNDPNKNRKNTATKQKSGAKQQTSSSKKSPKTTASLPASNKTGKSSPKKKPKENKEKSTSKKKRSVKNAKANSGSDESKKSRKPKTKQDYKTRHHIGCRKATENVISYSESGTTFFDLYTDFKTFNLSGVGKFPQNNALPSKRSHDALKNDSNDCVPAKKPKLDCCHKNEKTLASPCKDKENLNQTVKKTKKVKDKPATEKKTGLKVKCSGAKSPEKGSDKTKSKSLSKNSDVAEKSNRKSTEKDKKGRGKKEEKRPAKCSGVSASKKGVSKDSSPKQNSMAVEKYTGPGSGSKKKVAAKYQNLKPRGPRFRREASLNATAVMNILYERDKSSRALQNPVRAVGNDKVHIADTSCSKLPNRTSVKEKKVLTKKTSTKQVKDKVIQSKTKITKKSVMKCTVTHTNVMTGKVQKVTSKAQVSVKVKKGKIRKRNVRNPYRFRELKNLLDCDNNDLDCSIIKSIKKGFFSKGMKRKINASDIQLGVWTHKKREASLNAQAMLAAGSARFGMPRHSRDDSSSDMSSESDFSEESAEQTSIESCSVKDDDLEDEDVDVVHEDDEDETNSAARTLPDAFKVVRNITTVQRTQEICGHWVEGLGKEALVEKDATSIHWTNREVVTQQSQVCEALSPGSASTTPGSQIPSPRTEVIKVTPRPAVQSSPVMNSIVPSNHGSPLPSSMTYPNAAIIPTSHCQSFTLNGLGSISLMTYPQRYESAFRVPSYNAASYYQHPGCYSQTSPGLQPVDDQYTRIVHHPIPAQAPKQDVEIVFHHHNSHQTIKPCCSKMETVTCTVTHKQQQVNKNPHQPCQLHSSPTPSLLSSQGHYTQAVAPRMTPSQQPQAGVHQQPMSHQQPSMQQQYPLQQTPPSHQAFQQSLKPHHQQPLMHQQPPIYDQTAVPQQTPSVHQQPQPMHQQALSIHQQPSFYQQPPSVHHQPPLIHQQPPLHHQSQSMLQQMPAARQQTSAQGQPFPVQQYPSSVHQQPPVHQQSLSGHHYTSSAHQQNHSVHQSAHSVQEQSSSIHQRTTSMHPQPSVYQQLPSVHQQTSSMHQQPRSVHHQHGAVHQQASSGHHQSNSVHQESLSVHQQPPSLSVHQQTSSMHQHIPSVNQRTPSLQQPPSQVHQQPSQVHQQPSQVHQQPPHVHQQSPQVHQQPPPLPYQPPHQQSLQDHQQAPQLPQKSPQTHPKIHQQPPQAHQQTATSHKQPAPVRQQPPSENPRSSSVDQKTYIDLQPPAVNQQPISVPQKPRSAKQQCQSPYQQSYPLNQESQKQCNQQPPGQKVSPSKSSLPSKAQQSECRASPKLNTQPAQQVISPQVSESNRELRRRSPRSGMQVEEEKLEVGKSKCLPNLKEVDDKPVENIKFPSKNTKELDTKSLKDNEKSEGAGKEVKKKVEKEEVWEKSNIQRRRSESTEYSNGEKKRLSPRLLMYREKMLLDKNKTRPERTKDNRSLPASDKVMSEKMNLKLSLRTNGDRLKDKCANKLKDKVVSNCEKSKAGDKKSPSDKKQADIKLKEKQTPDGGNGGRKQAKRKKSIDNSWQWVGEPEVKPVFTCNDIPPVERPCYSAICHNDGDIIKVRDCVLLRSGPRKKDLPFIAKIAAFFEKDGEKMMSLLWYYRPEHTEAGRLPHHLPTELFASKHQDENSIACIEDKCHVLTVGKYCRYHATLKMQKEHLPSSYAKNSFVPKPEDMRSEGLPTDVDPETVFLCRRVYDFRQKRILKNPS